MLSHSCIGLSHLSSCLYVYSRPIYSCLSRLLLLITVSTFRPTRDHEDVHARFTVSQKFTSNTRRNDSSCIHTYDTTTIPDCTNAPSARIPPFRHSPAHPLTQGRSRGGEAPLLTSDEAQVNLRATTKKGRQFVCEKSAPSQLLCPNVKSRLRAALTFPLKCKHCSDGLAVLHNIGIFAIECAYLSLTRHFSTISEYITVNHTLPKSRLFGLYFCPQTVFVFQLQPR